MSDSNQFVALRPILNHYQIEPFFIEDFGKVQKIYSQKGNFALKKIDPQTGTDFIRHVHFLYQKGYNRIVPIYPTADGRYAVLHDKDLYYLMPWLPNEVTETRSERHRQLFRELARLHTLSAKEIPVKKEERTEHYEKTISQYEKNQEFLDGFVEECEKKTYMSPFELLFCLYFNEIGQALRFSKAKFEEWYENTKEQEKARSVIIHGKISSEHFLYDERGYGYFTNFEQAGFGSPIHDMLPFLSRTLNTRPKRNDECIEWVHHYHQYFPFKPDEKLLFLSYLAYPIPLIQVVEKYYHKEPHKRNELQFVRQLLRKYWHHKNTEYVAMRLADQGPETKEGALEV
ncbi:MAG: spore coat protein YsxE [Bacillota bacterium]|nr:spore coat protein YsxE [Bacillota bacterium]